MAARKKAETKTAKKAEEIEDAVIIQEPEGADDFNDDEPDEVAVRRILSGLGDESAGVLVTVYRLDDKNQKEYLFECQPDDFAMDNIRDDWGAGKYRIYARNSAGHFVLNRVVRIAAPLKSKQSDSQAVDLMSVITKLGEQQAQAANDMRTMILELMIKNQPAAQSFNPSDMMTSMVTTMAAVQKMLGGNNKTDPVDMLLKGLDLADKFGGGDRETGMFDVMKEVIRQAGGPLAKAAEASIANQETQPPRRRAAPGKNKTAIQNPKQPPGNPAPTPAEVAMEKLSKNIGSLLVQAKRNSDVSLWAELVIDSIPDNQWDQFSDLIFTADVVDRMAQVNPEVDQYRPWFEQLVEKIRWELTDTDDGDGLTGEGSGGIDANVNHSQQGKDAVTGTQGAADGVVAGQGGNGTDS